MQYNNKTPSLEPKIRPKIGVGLTPTEMFLEVIIEQFGTGVAKRIMRLEYLQIKKGQDPINKNNPLYPLWKEYERMIRKEELLRRDSGYIDFINGLRRCINEDKLKRLIEKIKQELVRN